jgi:hypothetical protein
MIDHHKSCRVHGGDGLAFVMHSDPRGTRALGELGEELGYGGIENGLAIEFDTWYNAEGDDLFEDHITIRSGGTKTLRSHPGQRLAGPKPHPLADGAVHAGRVRYYPYIAVCA